MEILKQGKVPIIHLFYTGTCVNCGCVVKCRDDDPEIIHPGVVVKCPTAGCEDKICLSLMPDKPQLPKNELGKIFDDLFPPKHNTLEDEFRNFFNRKQPI